MVVLFVAAKLVEWAVAAVVAIAPYAALCGSAAVGLYLLSGRRRHALLLAIGCVMAAVVAIWTLAERSHRETVLVEQQREAEVARGALAQQYARKQAAELQVEHRRVNEAIAGNWAGTVYGDPAQLEIWRDGAEIRAVLLRRYVRVTYRGRLEDDVSSGATSVVLVPAAIEGDSPRDEILRRTLALVPTAAGQLEGWRQESVRMKRDAESKSLREEPPATRGGGDAAKLMEIEPNDDLNLFDEPGDFTWDTLRLSDLKRDGLRIFDTNLVVGRNGVPEYRHVVVRDSAGQDVRKGWLRIDRR